MTLIQHTDATSIRTLSDQTPAISPDDGVKGSAPLAFRGSVGHTSTTSLTQSAGGLRTSPPRETQKLPAVDGDPAVWKRFRTTCDAILRELRRIKPAVGRTELPDDWVTAAAEIEGLVQELYDISWGKKDALKRVVVKVESQINNAIWTHRHVGFLEDVFVALRNRYSVNDTTVREVAELVKSHDLPLFRGSLSADHLRKQFKLVEVEPHDADE